MVHMLISRQLSAKMLFHEIPMLSNFLSIYFDLFVLPWRVMLWFKAVDGNKGGEMDFSEAGA